MYRREAVRRLKEHFRHHDDGRETPYLDEACRLAYDALDRYDQILMKFGTFERAMGAVYPVHCWECGYYHPNQMYCERPCERKMARMPMDYCSFGIRKSNLDEELIGLSQVELDTLMTVIRAEGIQKAASMTRSELREYMERAELDVQST